MSNLIKVLDESRENLKISGCPVDQRVVWILEDLVEGVDTKERIQRKRELIHNLNSEENLAVIRVSHMIDAKRI